jgi:plasmid stabilization system protein ParE
MAVYLLIPEAEEDLKGIARHTLKRWGEKQYLSYAKSFERRFQEISNRTVQPRIFSRRFPQVLMNKCEHHYIFYIHKKESVPLIIAILHERMDILSWIENRVDFQ